MPRGPFGGDGCTGGSAPTAYDYMIDNGGVHSGSSYPYTGNAGACRATQLGAPVVTLSRYGIVIPDSVQQLEAAVRPTGS